MKYLADLQKFLDPHRNEEHAVPMRKYMKNKFDFLGIKSPERKVLIKEFTKEYGRPDHKDLENIAIGLWSLPYRDYQYIGMEFIDRLLKHSEKEDIYAIEYMMEYKQWWDTIDFIASNLVGKLFKQHPELINNYFHKWNDSNDMWLNRVAILFQLKYKGTTDVDLLQLAIRSHAGSKEFFHRKAIGWALRQYARTDPDWVVDFVENNELSNLSKKEALKHIKAIS